MSIQVTFTKIPDVLVIQPTVYGDERGFFFESFNQKEFDNIIGQNITFVQDNHSKSKKGVLRGLHYQMEKTQGKLVRVIKGSVFDVAVDLRQSSTTYGSWVGVEISEKNKRQMWIPQGFAHGFLVLSDEAEFIYKTTDYYSPESERCLLWSDAKLSIAWPTLDADFSLAEKDRIGLSWDLAEKFT